MNQAQALFDFSCWMFFGGCGVAIALYIAVAVTVEICFWLGDKLDR